MPTIDKNFINCNGDSPLCLAVLKNIFKAVEALTTRAKDFVEDLRKYSLKDIVQAEIKPRRGSLKDFLIKIKVEGVKKVFYTQNFLFNFHLLRHSADDKKN
jgi:hypothetical protein